MFKKSLMALLLSGFASFAAHATVTVAGIGASNKAFDANGNPLPNGDIVRIGYFSSTANLGTDNSFSDLNSIFTPLGENIANAGTVNESGTTPADLFINGAGGSGGFSGSISGISATYLTQGNPLYLWIFNSSTASTASQWGIFSAASWTFPQDNSSATISLNSSGINILRGSANGSNFNLANVNSVPEPASVAMVLGSIGVCALVAKRRKI